jgi:serine/threonine-protein kinase
MGLAALLVAVVVVTGIIVLVRRASEPGRSMPTGATPFRTLAVLPFINVGGDTADVYFAEGMADELTTALVRVPGLRVAARSSVYRFKGGTAPAHEVGRALAVETILEGTVRRSGERLRVTAQLTNAADGLVLWADRFERRQQDVFDVQDEITHAIVTALRGTLAGEPATGAPRGTADLEAYDLYLKGRFFWAKRGEMGLRSAIDFFGRAIARDPDFARAHAGLAMSYVVLPIFTSSIPADSAIVLAQRSGERALALDPTLADAHLALANALKMKWRWAESERHFREALALAPDDAPAHHWYGVYLYALGRPEESARELQRAREIDPFGSTIATDGAIALYAARRFGEARAEIQRAYSLDSTKSDTHLILGLIQLAMGHADSALQSFENARRHGIGMDVRPYLSVSYRALARHREADAIYAELRRDYNDGRALAYDVAIAAIGAGDLLSALGAVERIIEERHMFVTELSLPCDPLFDSLKSEPRFGQLLSRAGMQVCPPAPLPYLDAHNNAR